MTPAETSSRSPVTNEPDRVGRHTQGGLTDHRSDLPQCDSPRSDAKLQGTAAAREIRERIDHWLHDARRESPKQPQAA
jgi:hypothetical protein